MRRTRTNTKAKSKPTKCYHVDVDSVYLKPGEVKVYINEATIVKETDSFYFVEPDLRYRKRIDKVSAITELKPHLLKLISSRYNQIERLECEIKALESKIEELEG